MEFYPCARPGRSGETTDEAPDEVVDKWASGLPKPKTPAPLEGPRRHCPALRAAAGQLHLGEAGPEDQILSEWLKSATLSGG